MTPACRACNADLCELCDAQFDPATECDCRHGEETDDAT